MKRNKQTGTTIAAQLTTARAQFEATVEDLSADAAHRASVVRERVAELESELVVLKGVQAETGEILG